MIDCSRESFLKKFNELKENDRVIIRHEKTKNGGIRSREVKIFHESGHLYVEIQKNAAEILAAKEKITSKTLQHKHRYLATLFSKLSINEPIKLSVWKSFKASKNKIKWLARFFILDTFVVGGVIGRVIAYVANKENPHYKTVPSQILGKTLGPLIFPAGHKKPTVIAKKGVIVLDPILYKQYTGLKNYQSEYQFEDEKIEFISKKVPMQLNGKVIQLDTIEASNELAKKNIEAQDKEYLHLLYFNGNSGCYEQDYKLVAEDLLHYNKSGIPVTATQYNYPGILNSEGQVRVAQDIVDSGIAQVQALINSGVNPKNIVLHGVSLGGSISSCVAAHFHRKKQSLGGLYASRTFASTTQVGRDFFNRALGDNIFSRLISTICLPFIKIGTWGSEWDLDTGKAFFSLPRNKRNYSVIITSREDKRTYRLNHPLPLRKRIVNFLLRKKVNPVDDAILRKGLHLSWEKRWDSLLTKCGWYGKKAREAYPRKNLSRKMVVFDFAKQELAPEIDGHAKASYCYQNHETWFNPYKSKKVIGLIHRPIRSENYKEAGSIARASILEMHRNNRV